ncbi:lipoate--protein ligase family protein [Marinobacterium sp. D7]|uniref:lipoyl protein ligase domain-containing protein n=1 Tax=Marinobacterium ramblicola TaxID=2849041 RepID=UPI001C2CE677|nr:lipoate--protein ligase family protein [Marinobacterium ramblicola]MBV1790170.1 lipoate--protein ligase family protein [Marinobacterium ramblicola]
MNAPAIDFIHPSTGSSAQEILPPAEGLAREMALLSSVTQGEIRAGFLIWRCSRSLVVPQRLTRRPQYAMAAGRMILDGWPVQVRATGGDLTPQSPGLINIALAFRSKRHKQAIRDSYMTLCQPLIDYLADLGIAAHCSAVDGAFCDGDYNLVVGDRKLAGTAQRWRQLESGISDSNDEFAVLCHAVLLCDEQLDWLWQAGNSFYHHCGIEPFIQAERHVSMAELLPARQALLQETIEQLEIRLTEYIRTL